MAATKHFSPSATWDQVQAEELKNINRRFDAIRRAGKKQLTFTSLIDVACVVLLPVTLFLMPYGVAFLDITFG